MMREVVFVFVKQKTAYEMRISDWSSDVCSSDLKFQHWLLNEEGARIATSRISAIRAFGTGLSRKPRIERRPKTTSSKPGAPVTSPSRGLLELQLEPVPDFDQRARQFAHHRLVVRGAGGEAPAFGAPRHGQIGRDPV